MKTSLIFAFLLLILVGVLYRYTERYEYDKPNLKKNEKISKIVKEKKHYTRRSRSIEKGIKEMK